MNPVLFCLFKWHFPLLYWFDRLCATRDHVRRNVPAFSAVFILFVEYFYFFVIPISLSVPFDILKSINQTQWKAFTQVVNFPILLAENLYIDLWLTFFFGLIDVHNYSLTLFTGDKLPIVKKLFNKKEVLAA